MEKVKILLIVLFVAEVLAAVLTVLACCKLSGDISREEEKENAE